jgi:chitinase
MKVRPDANLLPHPSQTEVNKQASGSQSVEAYIKLGFDPQKITLGLPAYGRGFAGVSGGDNGLFGSYTENTPVLTQKEIQGLKAKGFSEFWNDDMKQAYLFNPSTKEFFSYESERVVKEKITYIEHKDLAGAMIWDITIGKWNGVCLKQNVSNV